MHVRRRLLPFLALPAALSLAPSNATMAQSAPSERQTYVELFGPVQRYGPDSLNAGALDEAAPGQYTVPGAATSTSFKKFWFDRAWKSITWCAFRAEWRPATAFDALRLIHCDDGLANITQIAEFSAASYPPGRIGNPSVIPIDVTSAMRQLAAAGVPKNLGWQIKGDGVHAMTIYQVYLEILES